MKQVAQNYRSGELAVLDVPAPACKPGGVLVRSLFSLISTGTEMMKVSEARMSLIGKARARPDQVRKLLDSVDSGAPAHERLRALAARKLPQVEALIERGLVDPARVCIVGASYGGYAAMAGMTLDAGT